MSEWTVPGYTEQRALGRGASGRVVLAIHDRSGRQVAIKYLVDELVRDEGFLARFRQEAQLLLELNDPHVVRLIEYVEDPGRGAAIVMELVPGGSLYEMIDKTGPTSPEAALTVLKGSLLGLAAAHEMGVVHRDYKPENVLVDMSGNSKLSDFGIAVKAGRRVPSAGTPLYMAPEQWAGEPASPATDIYAATAVFYECLTGTTPYTGRIGQLRREHETADVPVEEVDFPVRGLVRRGMAKDPQDRPADATQGPVGRCRVLVGEQRPAKQFDAGRLGADRRAQAPSRRRGCCGRRGARRCDRRCRRRWRHRRWRAHRIAPGTPSPSRQPAPLGPGAAGICLCGSGDGDAQVQGPPGLVRGDRHDYRAQGRHSHLPLGAVRRQDHCARHADLHRARLHVRDGADHQGRQDQQRMGQARDHQP
jgi:tRNA A-37 threonylcarbamoyl transferase component Bud32